MTAASATAKAADIAIRHTKAAVAVLEAGEAFGAIPMETIAAALRHVNEARDALIHALADAENTGRLSEEDRLALRSLLYTNHPGGQVAP
jgi:tellurite resistance protein